MSDFEALWPGGPVFRQAAHVRLGTDTVLLADFAKPEGRLRGIDLGCASGALLLLLLARAPRLHMTGIELDPEAAERARENLAVNGLDTRGEIITGDLHYEIDQSKCLECGACAAQCPAEAIVSE